MAETLSETDSHDSWGSVWKRAIDPSGSFCSTCDKLSKQLFDKAPSVLVSRSSTDALLASVFGDAGLKL